MPKRKKTTLTESSAWLVLCGLAVAAAFLLGCTTATPTPATPTAGPVIVSARNACLEVKKAMDASSAGTLTNTEYVVRLGMALDLADNPESGGLEDPAVVDGLRRWNETLEAALAGQQVPPQTVEQAARDTRAACNPHYASMGIELDDE